VSLQNSNLDTLPSYTSKIISAQAKADPRIANLAIGEPTFGPPEHLRPIIEELLDYKHFLGAVKSYEISRGMLSLRQAISRWYFRKYGLTVDPEKEILITHGGVEAISLAILTTSEPGDPIVLTDPTYMLYQQSVNTLARIPHLIHRGPHFEYANIFEHFSLGESRQPKAIIINSPENPTGYVLSAEEWRSVAEFAQRQNLWVIHDEVYDTMNFGRPHTPARSVSGLGDRAILINSCSKKFGVPGLRIGWMCGPKEIIEKAEKIHDYLNLGVNALNEHVALAFLQDKQIDAWLIQQTDLLAQRAQAVVSSLNAERGYSWNFTPMGGMFAFPNVTDFYNRLPTSWHDDSQTPGEVVAQFLLRERQVAVVPGITYGTRGATSFRMVLCSDEITFRKAIDSLSL
jgi:aminotransferase